MIDLQEATGRWERVRRLMADQDLDAVVAIDLSRDEILQGHQRWLTGYTPVGGPAAALLHRDGEVELISDRIGKPAADFYKSCSFPIELVNGFSTALLAERVGRRVPRRIGIAEPETFSHELGAALMGAIPEVEIVDVSAGFTRLRLIKSPHELKLIRRSCAIADAVWRNMPEVFSIGRRYYEIVGDLDHLVRAEGAEGGFHLILPLPFSGRGLRALTNPDRIEADARYLMEISPRYEGYYSQLTIPVTSHLDDERASLAYDHVVAAKRAAEPLMRPGADLSQIAGTIEADLSRSGYSLTSRSLGHFCGMALEEPRHDPGAPFILEEGMTLIFHPVLGDADIRSLMRADTYLITAGGAERLTRYEGGLLRIG